MEPLLDTLGRPLETLRISITDRCNFRCVYCMPKEVFGRDHVFLERKELLSLEEIARVARRLRGARRAHRADHRRRAARAPERRAPRRAPARDPGLELALTTNGALLPQKAEALARAGLDRVTVSLDSVDDATFRALNDVDFPVQKVLDGIDAAAAAGLPRQGERRRQARRERRRHRRARRALPRHRPHAPLHRVHGRRPHERLAPRRRRLRATRSSRTIDAVWPLEPLAAGPPRRDRPPLPLPRRRRRDRRHRLGDQAVLRRLLPGPPLGRGPPPHLPFRR